MVLASGSAARRALLHSAGLTFDVHRPDVDEAAIKRLHRDAELAALALAEAKAHTANGDLVIGADQILVCGERWFDKPADLAEARRHLLALCGRRHELVTACVVLQHGTLVWRHIARPALTMRLFSDQFLDRYLRAEGEALCATVGAYRLEGLGIQLFDRVEGEHGTILGLPMLALLACLRDIGVVDA